MSDQQPSHRPTLDAVDRRILAVLEADGRASVSKLAERCHISRATAYARLERLQSSGVLQGFTVRVDHQRAGLGITAIVNVTMAQKKWRHALAMMADLPGVAMVAATTGEADVVLLVRAPDLTALRDMILERLQNMEEVRSTHSVIVLEERWPALLEKTLLPSV